MKIAILGLPQSGKRTLFSLLTGRETITGQLTEPIEGIAPVKDPRVDKIAEIEKPEKITYAETGIRLCPDIDPGSGSSSWIMPAKLSDLLCILIRDFSSKEVYHPSGSINAERDRNNIEAELLIADLSLIEKRFERISKDRKRSKPTYVQLMEESTIRKFQTVLEDNHFLNSLELNVEEYASVSSLNFLTLKPILWCLNVDEDKIIKDNDDNVFRVSALIEKEIASISEPAERSAFLNDLGLSESGVNRLNSIAYDLLGLMSFYTMGEDEARAWAIKKNTLAPVAGGKIHTDIERGFIRVEVIKFDDLLAAGSEKAVKASGKALLKGKDYVIEDGDICNFRFNV
ncbi:MAG: redox-regulated ATPase YchF [Candidatus Marinimicrobia bacterium]|nr:redox-regulated ATPase YchF [Candidatus Neomarinimicrobiota bacterium]